MLVFYLRCINIPVFADDPCGGDGDPGGEVASAKEYSDPKVPCNKRKT